MRYVRISDLCIFTRHKNREKSSNTPEYKFFEEIKITVVKFLYLPKYNNRRSKIF